MGIPLFEDKPFSIEDEMDYDYDYGADGGGFLPESEGTFDYIDSYDYESPRMTDEQNVQESENIVKHQDLIGKYVKIKDKYFLDNNIDLKVVASLKEYYKKGIYFGIVKSVSEDEGNINAYVEFNKPIGGIPSLFVPVDQLYNIPSMFSHWHSSLLDNEDDSPSEVILPSRIPDEENRKKVVGELTKKVSEILEAHVIDITKLIYRTERLMSYQKKQKIIETYMELTEQRGNRFNFIVIAFYFFYQWIQKRYCN